jgi:membrane associated rhomboid family serine protease
MSIINEIKDSFRQGSILTRLIYINIGVFLAFRFVQLFMLLGGFSPDMVRPWLAFFSIPAQPIELITHPWTPFTYMFLHFDFLHLIFNVLYLYWFGRLFIQIIGPRPFLKTYLIGGLSGALMFFLAINYLPAFNSRFDSNILMGASASVLAILFAVARYQPDFSVYLVLIGPVKLKYLALFALIIDLISIPTLNNTGGHLAHLGGALAGLWLGWQWASKGAPVQKMNISTPGKSSVESVWPFKKKSKLSVTHKRPLTDLEYNALKVRRQKEVDQILEKIKVSGYDSLNATEKKTLFEASKES